MLHAVFKLTTEELSLLVYTNKTAHCNPKKLTLYNFQCTINEAIKPVLVQFNQNVTTFLLPTNSCVLSKDERRHQVSPNSGRLKDEKEDAEIVVDHVRAFFVVFGGLHVPRYGQVGAFSRPQRRATQPQDH